MTTFGGGSAEMLMSIDDLQNPGKKANAMNHSHVPYVFANYISRKWWYMQGTRCSAHKSCTLCYDQDAGLDMLRNHWYVRELGIVEAFKLKKNKSHCLLVKLLK
jgi:hypothetical protein